MGIIKKLFGNKEKSEDELRAEVLKKATDHMKSTNESADPQDKNINNEMPAYETGDKDKKKNIRAVLLEIAERGETGISPIAISDKTGVSQVDTVSALAFLTKNNYAEGVNSHGGMKYYLTSAGRKFCISKEFNSGY